MKTISFAVDDQLYNELNHLGIVLGGVSRAQVFRLAIALLKIASEAHTSKQRIGILDKKGKLLRELIIPG